MLVHERYMLLVYSDVIRSTWSSKHTFAFDLHAFEYRLCLHCCISQDGKCPLWSGRVWDAAVAWYESEMALLERAFRNRTLCYDHVPLRLPVRR